MSYAKKKLSWFVNIAPRKIHIETGNYDNGPLFYYNLADEIIKEFVKND